MQKKASVPITEISSLLKKQLPRLYKQKNNLAKYTKTCLKWRYLFENYNNEQGELLFHNRQFLRGYFQVDLVENTRYVNITEL